MNDKQIRKTLIAWILAKYSEVRIYQEKSIGSSICDVMAVTNKLIGFEIKSDKRLGSQKMTECLAREYRIHISCGRVYRLMKTMNLPKMSTFKPPKQKSNSNAEGGICKNLLQQKFKPEKSNMAWVCDFTYIRAGGRFYYLCAIMDLFSRKIIAFRLSARINTDLAIATLEDAIRARGNGSTFL